MQNQYDDGEDEDGDRPVWITDDLIERTIQEFQPKSSVLLTESDAVQIVLSLSQLLEATNLLKLEIDDEEIYGMGTGK